LISISNKHSASLRVLFALGGARHDWCMLLKTERNDCGEERICVLPRGSIETYFVPRCNGTGVDLQMSAGMLAFDSAFEEDREAVRIAIVNKVATRLGVAPELVFEQPFSRYKSITDHLPIDDPWNSKRPRSRTSGRPLR
jgi:hypothetical protein